MHYPDLSLYEYMKNDDEPPALNIGWLGDKQPYPQGTPPEGFLDRIWIFCREDINVMRGFHECEVCEQPGFDRRVQRGDEELWFGSAEIWVFGADGTTYAAPNLIYHYILDHGYLPPAEFVEAVMYGPLPESPEYQERASAFEWGRMAARERRLRNRAGGRGA